jgi:hypothetical protein
MKLRKFQPQELPARGALEWHNRREMWEVRRRILLALYSRFQQEAARLQGKER